MSAQIYVLGYWSNAEAVSTDVEFLNILLKKKKGLQPELPWGVRTIQEALKHSYETGYRDGEDSVY